MDGETISGESDYFVVPPNGNIDVPQIKLGKATATPVTLTIAPVVVTLDRPGVTSSLIVTGTFRSGVTREVTAAESGVAYSTSNPSIATVSADGVVTAVGSGTAIIQASLEGKYAMSRVRVVLSVDTDGDGIPDDVELREGLNPKDPNDAIEDADRDGLSNKDEIENGTNLRDPDTDKDGILDGEEVVSGADGVTTNPLLADSDGDGVRDALEIQLGTNPNDPASVNLGAALSSMTVRPTTATIVVNTISLENTRQLTVTGTMIDGTSIDLTSSRRGTSYASSDLTVCSFGAQDGLIFGGTNGTCTIAVRNGSFNSAVAITVTDFSPTALSRISVPGATDVDVSGGFAYVSAGGSGLRVVNVSNPTAPALAATLALPGTAKDVRVVGNYAYVAAGSAGLHVVSVADPVHPALVASLTLGGDARDLVVRQGRAYVAAGSAGFYIASVSNPSTPTVLGHYAPAYPVFGVDVEPTRGLAALAQSGVLSLVDVSNPLAPVVKGSLSGGQVEDVAFRGDYVYLADVSRSLTVVDASNPSAPSVVASTDPTLGGRLYDVVLAGNFAVGADVYFVNGVPVVDVSSPAVPAPRAIINFAGDTTGIGVAADASYVYMVGDNGYLHIGQYLAISDDAGIAPTVTVTSPAANSTVVARSTIPVTVSATDDVAVVSAEVLFDGKVAGTRTSLPYEFAVKVPKNVTTTVVTARATDFGNNVGTAPAIQLNVVVGPVSKVTGRVTTLDGTPIAGALVSVVDDFTATSSPDGTFEIPSVPLAIGTFRVLGVSGSGAAAIRGMSTPTTGVNGGSVSVGDIRLSIDGDTDGLPDFFESTHACLVQGQDDSLADPDSDTISNLEELFFGTDPCAADSDRDGLSDAQERDTSRTDPLRADTDGDGFPDGPEIDAGTDPLNGLSRPLTVQTATGEVLGVVVAVLNVGGVSGAVSEVVSPVVSVFNASGGASGPSEVVSVVVAVSNGAEPAAGPRESISAVAAVLNAIAADSGPSEAVSPVVAVLNASMAPSANSEVASPLVIVLNEAAQTTAPESSRTSRSNSAEAIEVVLTAPLAGAPLRSGETLSIEAAATQEGVAAVTFLVNGVPLGRDERPPFTTVVTLPFVQQLTQIALEARGEDTSGRMVGSVVRVQDLIPSTFTTVTGIVIDADGRPVTGANVLIDLAGAQAEYFDVPSMGAPSSQALGGPPRRAVLLSGLSLVNPEGVFGVDPWGAGLMGGYLARYRFVVNVAQGGVHTFSIRDGLAASLTVDGQAVVPWASAPDGEMTGATSLERGTVSVELLVQHAKASGVRLEVSSENGEPSPLHPASYFSPAAAVSALTGDDGRFVVTGVPGYVAGFRAVVSTADGARHGSSPFTTASGRATEVMSTPIVVR